MSTTTNPNSVLFQLRQLMPRRPLTQFEAYRLAELQANHLLRRAGIDQPGTPSEIISGLPFVTVELRSDLPISGLTNWYKPRWVIVLNSDEPGVRRRFSLMHEAKHLLDHGIQSFAYPDQLGRSSDERTELIADHFAASVLMPRRLVKRRYYEGQSVITELAAEFGVSAQAMRFRLEQLGIIERRPRCLHTYRDTSNLTGYFRRAVVMEPAA
jgi:hypothetical protein